MTAVELVCALAAAGAVALTGPRGRSLRALPRGFGAPGGSPGRAGTSTAGSVRRAPPRAGPALVGASVGVATGSLVGGPLGWAAAVPVAVLAGRRWAAREPAEARRRRLRLEDQLPLVVDLLAAALGSGAAPGTALPLVADAVGGPMREELRPVVARLRLGADPVAVWAGLGEHPQLAPLGRTLLRAAESGTAVAPALAGLAEEQRRAARAAAEVRARAVGVQAVAPLGLCLLPAFVLTGVVPLVAGAVADLLGG